VVLFGSMARGLAGADSDIDVLIVVDSVTENIRRAAVDALFQAGLRYGESIEYIIMSTEEYRSRSYDNSFIYEIERWGKALYERPESKVTCGGLWYREKG